MGVYLCAASAFTVDELADIYNRSRSDYLVPMQMTPAQLEDYMRRYDIAPDASCVALDDAGEPAGVGMLGLRGDRAWVTRLGVMPSQRGRQIGRHIMNGLIGAARERRLRLIQLEVIIGNEPGRRLFTSCGFQPLRELMIVHRDPGALALPPMPVPPLELDAATCALLLPSLTVGASWVGEARSIIQSGKLTGFRLGGTSVVCHAEGRHIEHIMMDTADTETAFALLRCLHSRYPDFSAIVENIPADSPLLAAYAGMGYTVAFRRTEMRMVL